MSAPVEEQSVQSQLTNVAARKNTTQTHPGQREAVVSAAKLAKNKRLPATMITPGGNIETSKKKNAKGRQMSAKKRKASEAGKEKALERMERLDQKVRQRDDRQAKRQRAKKAWE